MWTYADLCKPSAIPVEPQGQEWPRGSVTEAVGWNLLPHTVQNNEPNRAAAAETTGEPPDPQRTKGHRRKRKKKEPQEGAAAAVTRGEPHDPQQTKKRRRKRKKKVPLVRAAAAETRSESHDPQQTKRRRQKRKKKQPQETLANMDKQRLVVLLKQTLANTQQIRIVAGAVLDALILTQFIGPPTATSFLEMRGALKEMVPPGPLEKELQEWTEYISSTL